MTFPNCMNQFIIQTRRGVFCAAGTELSDVVYMNLNLQNFSVKNLISTLNAGKTHSASDPDHTDLHRTHT
jgi:hypothetical protein